jgi:nitrous oxidase accessory protein NosD
MRLTKAGIWAVVCLMPLAAQKDGKPVPGSGLIDQPGSYVLQGDRASSAGRAAILITANNVTLDLNGMVLTGPGNKAGVGVEIRRAHGVKVRNGHIANTAFGVVVMASNNVVIEELQIRGEGLPVLAPPPETGIMIVQSKNVVVERNSSFNTGLGIFVRGGQSGGNRIAHNTVTAGTNGVLGICYNPADNDPQGPRGDLIYRNVIHGFGVGVQASMTSQYSQFIGNTVFYRSQAFDLQNATNMAKDNVEVSLQ